MIKKIITLLTIIAHHIIVGSSSPYEYYKDIHIEQKVTPSEPLQNSSDNSNNFEFIKNYLLNNNLKDINDTFKNQYKNDNDLFIDILKKKNWYFINTKNNIIYFKFNEQLSLEELFSFTFPDSDLTLQTLCNSITLNYQTAYTAIATPIKPKFDEILQGRNRLYNIDQIPDLNVLYKTEFHTFIETQSIPTVLTLFLNYDNLFAHDQQIIVQSYLIAKACENAQNQSSNALGAFLKKKIRPAILRKNVLILWHTTKTERTKHAEENPEKPYNPKTPIDAISPINKIVKKEYSHIRTPSAYSEKPDTKPSELIKINEQDTSNLIVKRKINKNIIIIMMLECIQRLNKDYLKKEDRESPFNDAWETLQNTPAFQLMNTLHKQRHIALFPLKIDQVTIDTNGYLDLSDCDLDDCSVCPLTNCLSEDFPSSSDIVDFYSVPVKNKSTATDPIHFIGNQTGSYSNYIIINRVIKTLNISNNTKITAYSFLRITHSFRGLETIIMDEALLKNILEDMPSKSLYYLFFRNDLKQQQYSIYLFSENRHNNSFYTLLKPVPLKIECNNSSFYLKQMYKKFFFPYLLPFFDTIVKRERKCLLLICITYILMYGLEQILLVKTLPVFALKFGLKYFMLFIGCDFIRIKDIQKNRLLKHDQHKSHTEIGLLWISNKILYTLACGWILYLHLKHGPHSLQTLYGQNIDTSLAIAHLSFIYIAHSLKIETTSLFSIKELYCKKNFFEFAYDDTFSVSNLIISFLQNIA